MIKTQYPYIDDNAVAHTNLVKHWTDNPAKVLLQVETGHMYDEAIDVYPCAFTYNEVDKPVKEVEEDTNGEDN